MEQSRSKARSSMPRTDLGGSFDSPDAPTAGEDFTKRRVIADSRTTTVILPRDPSNSVAREIIQQLTSPG